MDRLIGELSERLAQPWSRRRFLAALGAGTVIGSAALSGAAGSLVTEGLGTAAAAPNCCSGSCSCPSLGACPTGTSQNGSYTCCVGGTGPKYSCYDCYFGSTYVCTYSVYFSSQCPQKPLVPSR